MSALSRRKAAIVLGPLLVACGAAKPAPPTPSAPPPAAPLASVAPSAPSATPIAQPTVDPGTPCGGLGCRAFATPEAAFNKILEARPKVLAIGEAHAQKGSEGIASSTRRFTESFLPLLRDKAAALVLELWVQNGSCGKVEKQVAEQQKPVTASQSMGNQNEFMELGRRAKSLGIAPQALLPSCEQYDKIAGSGGTDIAEMLRMIANTTLSDVKKLLESKELPAERLILAYGGAMHNDIVPRAGREDWSFGPALSQLIHERYVELDLIVPEYVKDTEVWQSFPWFSHFDREHHGDRTLLFNPYPHSYVLIFPKTKQQ